MLQTSQKINFREERDFGEKLNATFYFIRTNSKALGNALLLYVTPVALLAGIFSGLHQSRLFQTLNGEGAYASRTLGEFNFFNQVTSLNYVITLFFTFISYVAVALTVYSFMVAYMDEDGEVTPASVWVNMKENLLKATYSSLALGIVCFLSLFLLGLGLYLAVVLSLFLIVMVREETGFVDSIERCFYLIKGNWWATFALILVIGFIQSMIVWIAALPVGIVMLLRVLELPGAGNETLFIAANTLSTILAVFTYAISMVALAFQYFNLVEEKDGIGMLEQVNLIGSSGQKATANEGDF